MELYEFARPALMSGKTILFVHGFASSGRSGTARALRILLPEAEVLAPDLPVETDEGFRQNVIFPYAMLLEDDGEVKIYYGASDTCVCLATAKLDDLLELLK